MRTVACLALAASLFFVDARASAFCGFYVAGTDSTLASDATLVVLMREGTRTVVSMQNAYQGPPEAFALVVPVPVVLRREDVKTLPAGIFARVEQLSAPRLVEYWETDPCLQEGIGLGGMGYGSGAGSGYGRGGGMFGRGGGVTIEAQFAVGEYDILILSARDSGGLETWLTENHYNLPAGSGEALRPYVAAGMKFFVAKVDPARVRFEHGRAVLSPLRFHYDSETFSLPVRLGLLNSPGTQDLIVMVLANGKRYELANYENTTIPTNLDVEDSVRTQFGAFYAALFDRVVAEHPRTAVTEYAWATGNCDPCPGIEPLTDNELATLGGDVAFPGAQGGPMMPRARIDAGNVEGTLSRELIRRVALRHVNEVRYCHEQQLTNSPALAGDLLAHVTIGPTGAVTEVRLDPVAPALEAVAACVSTAIRRWAFPSPTDGAAATADLRVSLTLGPAQGFGGRSAYGDPVLTRLHLRYGRDALGDDLVFREALPIVGGREYPGGDGALSTGSAPDSSNNFQARYAIRHAWTGPIACDAPVRGRWSGTPPEGTQAAGTIGATGLATAPRGGVQLDRLLRTPLDAAANPLTPAPSPALPAPEIPAAPETPAPAAASAQPARSGCGCRVPGGSPTPLSGVLVGLVVIAPVLRRRRC